MKESGDNKVDRWVIESREREGFWSEGRGWIPDINEADLYTTEQKAAIDKYPTCPKKDAKWLPVLYSRESLI